MTVTLGLNGSRKRLPLWHRIELVLREKIATGEFRAGQSLPSEPTLATSFGVSRMTVREAIRGLTSEGLVRQVQGRGTFVLPPPEVVEQSAGLISSFIGDLKYNDAFPALSPDPGNRVPHCSWISRRTVPSPLDITEALALQEPTVVLVERVVTNARDEPLGYVADYLPHALGDRLRESDLRRAWLTQVLTEKLGVPVLEAHQTIQATLADVALGEKLEVPFGAPLLHAQRLYLGKHGQRLYVARVWHRADRFRYSAVFRIHDAGDRSAAARVTSETQERRRSARVARRNS